MACASVSASRRASHLLCTQVNTYPTHRRRVYSVCMSMESLGVT